MRKDELISFCSKEDTPEFDGIIHYQNPKYFNEMETVPSYATHFYTKDERVRKKYLESGVKEYVQRKEEKEVGRKEEVQVDSSQEDKEDAVEAVSSPDADRVGRNPDEMSWPELRSYAASLTDEPIKSKKQALQVVKDLG